MPIASRVVSSDFTTPHLTTGNLEINIAGRRNTAFLQELISTLPERAAFVSWSAANIFLSRVRAIAPAQEPNSQGIQNDHRKDNQSRHLRDSFGIHSVDATHHLVYNDAPWAASVEFGADAHEISGNLNFWWEAAGRKFITRKGAISSVWHPGQAAHPYFEPIANSFGSTYYNMIRRMFQ